MTKIFLYILLGALISANVHAKATDKIKHCPTLEQIEITRVQKPWTHYYWAYNNDQKYFVSKEYTEDDHNGPAPPVEFLSDLSSYDIATKTLSCVYYAYTRKENIHPILINIGDY